MSSNGERADRRGDDGFEFHGEFFPWHVSDIGKDLMLIDRFSNMPVAEFFETVEDNFDRGRAPILLTLIATSIRAKHPEWSVERIVRTVMDLNLGEIEIIEDDTKEETLPPASEAEEESTGVSSASELKLPSSETAQETSETFSETQV